MDRIAPCHVVYVKNDDVTRVDPSWQEFVDHILSVGSADQMYFARKSITAKGSDAFKGLRDEETLVSSSFVSEDFSVEGNTAEIDTRASTTSMGRKKRRSTVENPSRKSFGSSASSRRNTANDYGSRRNTANDYTSRRNTANDYSSRRNTRESSPNDSIRGSRRNMTVLEQRESTRGTRESSPSVNNASRKNINKAVRNTSASPSRMLSRDTSPEVNSRWGDSVICTDAAQFQSVSRETFTSDSNARMNTLDADVQESRASSRINSRRTSQDSSYSQNNFRPTSAQLRSRSMKSDVTSVQSDTQRNSKHNIQAENEEDGRPYMGVKRVSYGWKAVQRDLEENPKKKDFEDKHLERIKEEHGGWSMLLNATGHLTDLERARKVLYNKYLYGLEPWHEGLQTYELYKQAVEEHAQKQRKMSRHSQLKKAHGQHKPRPATTATASRRKPAKQEDENQSTDLKKGRHIRHRPSTCPPFRPADKENISQTRSTFAERKAIAEMTQNALPRPKTAHRAK